jgi:hypothetical protein
VRRDRELRCAPTVRAQRARDMDRDGRRWAHKCETKAIIGRWDDATVPPRQRHPPLVANPEEST